MSDFTDEELLKMFNLPPGTVLGPPVMISWDDLAKGNGVMLVIENDELQVIEMKES